jgi:hypothetical protein
VSRSKQAIGNRIARAINLGELQWMRICRRIRQRRARQQEAREADRAVVVVIGKPRRKLFRDLRPWSGIDEVHGMGAVDPSDGEIMLVDMSERQRELQRECSQREIGSASAREGSRQHHFCPCQRAVPLLPSGALSLPPLTERAQWPLCIGDQPAMEQEIWRSRGYERAVTRMFPFEGAAPSAGLRSLAGSSYGCSSTASAGVDALARAVAADRSPPGAGSYWSASCLKEIGSSRFWPKETVEPILAQYNKARPAPAQQPTPIHQSARDGERSPCPNLSFSFIHILL